MQGPAFVFLGTANAEIAQANKQEESGNSKGWESDNMSIISQIDSHRVVAVDGWLSAVYVGEFEDESRIFGRTPVWTLKGFFNSPQNLEDILIILV